MSADIGCGGNAEPSNGAAVEEFACLLDAFRSEVSQIFKQMEEALKQIERAFAVTSGVVVIMFCLGLPARARAGMVRRTAHAVKLAAGSKLSRHVRGDVLASGKGVGSGAGFVGKQLYRTLW